jgi:hypothetical protein
MKVSYGDPEIRQALRSHFGEDPSNYPVNVTLLAPGFLETRYTESLKTKRRQFGIFNTDAGQVLAELPVNATLTPGNAYIIGREHRDSVMGLFEYEETMSLPYPAQSSARVFAAQSAQREIRKRGDNPGTDLTVKTEPSVFRRNFAGAIIKRFGTGNGELALLGSGCDDIKYHLVNCAGISRDATFLQGTAEPTQTIIHTFTDPLNRQEQTLNVEAMTERLQRRAR